MSQKLAPIGSLPPIPSQCKLATEATMKCDYCREKASLFLRVCPPCAKVIAIVDKAAGEVGLAQLVDLFAVEGLTRQQVNRVLDAQIRDQPTIRDRLTSNMANALMRNLGMPGRQSPEDVRRVRLAGVSGAGAGTWTGGERSPGGN